MKEIIAKLAGMRRRLQWIGLVAFAALIAAAALLVFGQRVPGMILGVAVLAFNFFWLRRKMVGYSDEIARASVLNGLAEPLKDPVFLDRGGMTMEAFDALAILPVRRVDNALMLRQGFEGRLDGGVCRGWEITFHYRRDPERRADYAFFSGTLLTKVYDRPIPGAGDWLALRDDLLPDPALRNFLAQKGYRPAEAEDGVPGGEILWFKRCEGGLPAEVTSKLRELFEKLDWLGAVRLTPECAAVYLDRRFYTQRVKVRFLPGEAQLRANPLQERDDIWDLFLLWQRSGAKEA